MVSPLPDPPGSNGDPQSPVREGSPPSPKRSLQQALLQIEQALRGLKFGQVTISVQDGVVVQIDRLERTRIQRL